MFLVISKLYGTAPLGLLDSETHGVGNLVGVHDNSAVEISGGASYCLCQRPMAAQESLLVGVENCHKRYLGKIEPLTKEVHADKHVVGTGTQVVEYADTVERIYIAMYVSGLYAHPEHKLVKFFGHTLGKRGNKHTFAALDAQLYLLHQIVDLVETRTHVNYRVKESGRTYKLLHDYTVTLFKLVIGGSGRYIDSLLGQRLEFVEFQRAVVERGR